MSSEHCPDCLWGGFKRVGDKGECIFCGWKGNVSNLRRVELTKELYDFIDNRKLRKDRGELFFVRVKMSDSSVQQDISDLLFCRFFGHSEVKDEYIFEVWGKLPQSVLDKIKEMKGVEWVKLF